MSKIISDTHCPRCRENGGDSTGNHLMLFEDGGSHCNRCDYSQRSPIDPVNVEPVPTPTNSQGDTHTPVNLSWIEAYPSSADSLRGITAETYKYFGVKTEMSQSDGSTVVATFFPRSTSIDPDTITAYKKKTPDKSFSIIGTDKNPSLFGQNKAPHTKSLYITEGCQDACIVFQCLKEEAGSEWSHFNPAVVSIPNGAGGAARAIADNLQFVNGYDKIVICFDSDEPGKKATDEVCRLIGSKAHVAKLGSFKDANEIYLAGRGKELKAALVFNATKYMPAGIATVADLIDEACKKPTLGISYPWPSLTTVTYGLQTKQLIGVAAGVGIGKTDFFSQLAAHIVDVHGEAIGQFKLEEPPARSLKAIAGKVDGIAYHKPDSTFDEEALRESLLKLDGKIYSYNHFGYKDWAAIKSDIRVLRAYGVKWFIIDPLTALVAHEADENKALNEMLEEMASLTQELDLTIFYSCHLNSPPRDRASHEEGGAVKESQLTGSRAMVRWSHYIWGLQRNKHAVDEVGEPDFEVRNTTKFVLLKDREYGSTCSFDIYYDVKTTRYLEPTLIEEEVMY